MNVINMITQELADKDWDLLTQARYIYLRTCELFTYDPRYNYLEDFEKLDILNRKIDLENVTDNKVVCHSWSREVYIPLLKLIGIKGELIAENNFHEKVIFSIDNKIYNADACLSSDLARVKMNNTTKRFYPIDAEKNFESKLLEIDKNIAYIKDTYSNEKILTISHDIELKFKKELEKEKYNLELADEILIYKLYKIKELVNNSPYLKDYYDYSFCLTYLYNKLFTKIERRKILFIELYNYKIIDWDFKQVFPIRLNGERRYFALDKINSQYDFHEITKNEAENLVNDHNYAGRNKSLIKF